MESSTPIAKAPRGVNKQKWIWLSISLHLSVCCLSPSPSHSATITDGHVLYTYWLHNQLRVPGNREIDIQAARYLTIGLSVLKVKSYGGLVTRHFRLQSYADLTNQQRDPGEEFSRWGITLQPSGWSIEILRMGYSNRGIGLSGFIDCTCLPGILLSLRE